MDLEFRKQRAASSPRIARRAALVALAFVPLVALAAAVSPDRWSALEHSRWIEDGKAAAPRTVYVFTDANCPFCNRVWSDARPWVDSGKLQIRHVMVGVLTPTSNGKAATLLTASDPAAALAAYEQSQRAATTKMIDSGHVHALAADELAPLDPVPAPIQAALDSNRALMQSLGARATPSVAFRDADGTVQVMEGVRVADEGRIFGPK